MSEILREIEAILKANTLLDFVGNGVATTPLASETYNTAVYIHGTNIVPKLVRTAPNEVGYDNHMFCSIILNADCGSDTLRIYDVMTSVIKSILNDSQIWDKAINRDIITVEFDNAEFYPKRSAMLVLEVTHDL